MTDLKKLTEPFPRTAIKQRSVQGKSLDYVEGHTVIHRLNAATENQWSMEVKSISSIAIREDWTQVTAHVALTIPGLGTREHIGIQDVHVKGPDLVKGAITDALKKAATLFGVGLELYGPDYESGEIAAPRAQNTAPAPRRQPETPLQPQRPQQPASQPQGQNQPAPGPGGATVPQIRNLYRLGKKLGWSEDNFHQELFEAWSVESTNELTKQQASDWIKALKKAAGEEDEPPPQRQQAPSFGGMAGPEEPAHVMAAPDVGEPGNDRHTAA